MVVDTGGNQDFPEDEDYLDRRSAAILKMWAKRSAPDREITFKELEEKGAFKEKIGRKIFDQWYLNKRISARNEATLGERVVAIVDWYIRENNNRKVIQPPELEAFIALYPHLPAKNILQLRRLLFELKAQLGEIRPDVYAITDWKKQFSEWTTFGFVVDQYWCIQAYSKYSMELAGLREEDAQHWYWWHRLALGWRGQNKYRHQNTLLSLRGPYADEYYFQQMLRFRHSIESTHLNDERFQTMMALLRRTPQFVDRWERVEEAFAQDARPLTLIPVPFFRPDKTMLWMLEVSVPIQGTAYHFVARLPTDAVSSEYLAELRHSADEPGKYAQNGYFIEDYAANFSMEERNALGITTPK